MQKDHMKTKEEPKAILKCPHCFGTQYIFKREKQDTKTGHMTFIKCTHCQSGFIEYNFN